MNRYYAIMSSQQESSPDASCFPPHAGIVDSGVSFTGNSIFTVILWHLVTKQEWTAESFFHFQQSPPSRETFLAVAFIFALETWQEHGTEGRWLVVNSTRLESQLARIQAHLKQVICRIINVTSQPMNQKFNTHRNKAFISLPTGRVI